MSGFSKCQSAYGGLAEAMNKGHLAQLKNE